MRSSSLLFLLSLTLAGSLGCSSVPLEPPLDFVQLERKGWSPYLLRATNARGVVLAIREEPNEVEGSLAFWREAVKERLQKTQGYSVLSSRQVQSADGTPGAQLHFKGREAEASYRYWVSLFVVPAEWPASARVVIVEAGGREADFEAVQDELDQSLLALRLD